VLHLPSHGATPLPAAPSATLARASAALPDWSSTGIHNMGPIAAPCGVEQSLDAPGDLPKERGRQVALGQMEEDEVPGMADVAGCQGPIPGYSPKRSFSAFSSVQETGGATQTWTRKKKTGA
jgi:hypothetical protein